MDGTGTASIGDIMELYRLIGGRLGSENRHLRIFEDSAGLHVLNVDTGTDLLLWREPADMFGTVCYGRILYSTLSVSYLQRRRYEYAVSRLLKLAGDVLETNGLI